MYDWQVYNIVHAVCLTSSLAAPEDFFPFMKLHMVVFIGS
jgi:hypothetical protein